MNEVIVSSPNPCLFRAATEILYVVYGASFSNLYLLTISVVVFRMRDFSFFSLIHTPVRFLYLLFSESSQDISALLDLMLVTVKFEGSSGNCRAGKKGIMVA